MSGIYFLGATSGNSTIASNLIHSLNLASNNAGSSLTGIMVDQGNVTVQNNMVRIGWTPPATAPPTHRTSTAFTQSERPVRTHPLSQLGMSVGGNASPATRIALV